MDGNVLRLTRVGLLIASLGAVLIVFDIFGLAEVGLVLAVAGAVLAARGGAWRTWYLAVAGGAALAVLSRLVAESAETLGGWLAVGACLSILIGTSLGYPPGESPEQ
jgi:hypothetical protein